VSVKPKLNSDKMLFWRKYKNSRRHGAERNLFQLSFSKKIYLYTRLHKHSQPLFRTTNLAWTETSTEILGWELLEFTGESGLLAHNNLIETVKTCRNVSSHAALSQVTVKKIPKSVSLWQRAVEWFV